jgi:hypothetical protein
MVLKIIQAVVFSIAVLCVGFFAAQHLTEPRENAPRSAYGRLRIDNYEAETERAKHLWERSALIGAVAFALTITLSSALGKPAYAAIVSANPLTFGLGLLAYLGLHLAFPAISIQVGEFISLRVYLGFIAGAALGSMLWSAWPRSNMRPAIRLR